MKPLYLALSVLGYAVTGALLLVVSARTGNWLFVRHPAVTLAGLFANGYAATFVADLLLAVLPASAFFLAEGRRLGMRRPWGYVALTLLLGVAGTLPLFLYFRERRLERAAA